jgi:hypothetical protein
MRDRSSRTAVTGKPLSQLAENRIASEEAVYLPVPDIPHVHARLVGSAFATCKPRP